MGSRWGTWQCRHVEACSKCFDDRQEMLMRRGWKVGAVPIYVHSFDLWHGACAKRLSPDTVFPSSYISVKPNDCSHGFFSLLGVLALLEPCRADMQENNGRRISPSRIVRAHLGEDKNFAFSRLARLARSLVQEGSRGGNILPAERPRCMTLQSTVLASV